MSRFRNLNLRFLEEEGGEGAGGGDQTQVIDQGQETTPPQGQPEGQQPTGVNPAWDPIRSAIDPITFSKIEPHLKEMDKNAQTRIQSLTKQFEPFQAHLKGRDPSYVGKALTYADELEKDPARVYQMLGQFLQQTGRFPTQQEAEQALENQEGQEQEQQTDPRLEQLQQQQEAIRQYILQQQQEEAVRQADYELNQATTALREAHKELTDPDVREIISRAAFAAQRNPGQVIDFSQALEAAYTEFTELKNRILSTPRPGDSAPQLPPISGGSPTAPGQQQKSWGQYKSEEIVDFIAGQLSQNKG